MLLCFGVLLLSNIYFTLAQESDNCECVSYFYCNATQYENDKCDGLYEVCCEITEATSSPVDPTVPSVFVPTPTFSVAPPTPDIITAPVLDPSLEQTPLTSDPNLCGVRVKPAVYDWKVVTPDESATAFGEFPWMVAIMSVDTAAREKFLCGGSLIYPNIVLTTAHNIRQFEAHRLRVKAGVWNTNDESERSRHQVRFVQTRILHSGFNQTSAANDVGLLVLNENLQITNNVAPICLPSTLRRYNTTNCIATGWGAENFGSGTVGGQLKMVQLPLIDFNSCQNRLRKIPKLGPNFIMHRSFICAGGDARDTCKGDGGGPLICPLLEDPNRYVQVGITSWGIGCGENPGVYSSVSEAAEWIETMADAFPSAPEPTVPPRSRPFARELKNVHSKLSC